MIQGLDATDVFVKKTLKYPPNCKQCRMKFRPRDLAFWDNKKDFWCLYHKSDDLQEMEIPDKNPYFQKRR